MTKAEAESKIIHEFLKDKQKYVVLHKEVLCASEIGTWAVKQGTGYFVHIPLDEMKRLMYNRKQ